MQAKSRYQVTCEPLSVWHVSQLNYGSFAISVFTTIFNLYLLFLGLIYGQSSSCKADMYTYMLATRSTWSFALITTDSHVSKTFPYLESCRMNFQLWQAIYKWVHFLVIAANSTANFEGRIVLCLSNPRFSRLSVFGSWLLVGTRIVFTGR